MLFADIDECDGINLCDQSCHNNIGSYTCRCTSSYLLGADAVSCEGNVYVTILFTNICLQIFSSRFSNYLIFIVPNIASNISITVSFTQTALLLLCSLL